MSQQNRWCIWIGSALKSPWETFPNDWNAISIIALAQSNPLKAVAEFIESRRASARRRRARE
jgi:hypothetical protein